MGSRILRILILMMALFGLIPTGVWGDEKPTWIPTPEERADRPWIPAPDQVVIGRFSITMPLGRILLVRKGPEYLALKFTNTWLGETKYDHYTAYEFHYQGDGSGDFSKNNVQSGTDELFFPRRRSWMGIGYVIGGKEFVRYGGIKAKWLYTANVRICGNELAPTPWTSITEVNVHDQRIQWYREDSSRKKRMVEIDRLWDKKGDISE